MSLFYTFYQKSWWHDLQFLQYRCDRLKLVIMGHFFALLPPFLKTKKKSEFWKNENKLLEISSFYTCAPKTTIIRGTVPEIQSETNRIFCHFGSFFAILSPHNPDNQNFEKMKRASGDVTILHMHTKNHNYMCDSLEMDCDRHVLFILDHFFPFYPLLTTKIKIWKKRKKNLEILSFYTCVPKMKIIWSMVRKIRN